MKPASGKAAPRRPNQPTQCPNTEFPSRSVFGFPVSVNQFQSLHDSELAASTNQVQREGLINPRTTRLARLQVARRTSEQGTLGNKGILNTVPLVRNEQGILHSGGID